MNGYEYVDYTVINFSHVDKIIEKRIFLYECTELIFYGATYGTWISQYRPDDFIVSRSHKDYEFYRIQRFYVTPEKLGLPHLTIRYKIGKDTIDRKTFRFQFHVPY